MKVKDIRADFTDSLIELYEPEEVLSFFYMLSEKISNLTRVDVAIHLDKELPQEEIKEFEKAKKRLKDQEPIQYILGETHFYGLPFMVNKNVLIPRPETEELIDWILKDQKGNRSTLKILDIGTGSGCIAISLAKNLPNAKVQAIDISEKAIEVAKTNAKRNKVSVKFIHQDILKTDNLSEDFDIIVSNPPYVRALEKKEIKPNVLNNEPHQALFVSDIDPLIFYEKITNLAKKRLSAIGVLYFEINQYLGPETVGVINKVGFDLVELRKDLYNNERMIRASLTKNI
ncbi:peptide chain release factor N(5)-glutamine methyltransferase [Aquimarina gracilis]|uniref:Release factor glutamine methyltransferase n=1 Tax=Aquimarina gracilis TaxID=874422 RepID=A0ABU5ZV42_9FLAO|nr:peptide chain release factor N(5)-glutamine methyltransferase [Aquimarina gracilis]MEB3345543.1 peptide chain release factor N(5)-glutamine methyltransferase [Aquimarina gracilis]